MEYEEDVKGKNINPREVLLKVLDPIVELGEKDDAVLLRVVVSGENAGSPATYAYEMTTYKDRENNITAMARATANTISVVAQMIGNGTITKKGVYPPEQMVPGETYIDRKSTRLNSSHV